MAVRQRRTTRSLIVLVVVATAGVAACSGKSATKPGAANSGPTSAASATTSVDASSDTSSGSVSAPSTAAAAAVKASDMSMRVVNLYTPKGDSGPPAAGPALDVYDVQLTGQPATPVAAGVAYGSASPYFTVHEPANSFGHPQVQLYALPAGEDPKTKQADAKGIGGAIDDGSHAQITFVLSADNGGLALPGPLGRLSFSDRVEKGDDGNGSKAPVAPAPASGAGEILVDTSALGSQALALYLLIDHSCAPPINGDPNAKGLPEIFNSAVSGISTPYAIFVTTPGQHQVSVVNVPGGIEPTCARLTAKQGTTSVSVAAGQQVEAYVYGTSATDLHLAFAPLRP